MKLLLANVLAGDVHTPANQGRHTFTVTATRGGYSLFGVRDVATPTVNGLVAEIDVVCPELAPFRLIWSDGFVQENITTLSTTRITNAGGRRRSSRS